MRVIQSKQNPALKTDIVVEKPQQAELTMETTEKAIDKTRRNTTLSNELKDLLINQLKAELTNYHIYCSFSTYYASIGLLKLSKYYHARAMEENNHHLWIKEYLTWCGIYFNYPEIDSVNVNITDELMPIKATVDREIETTGCINNIAKQALEEGDYATFTMLNGNMQEFGQLIPEQIEEERTSRNALHIAEQDTDWLTKEDAIFNMYFNK